MRVILNAAQIRAIMYEMGITQSQLATVTGLSRPTVNAVLNGKSCSPDTARAIYAALKIAPPESLQ